MQGGKGTGSSEKGRTVNWVANKFADARNGGSVREHADLVGKKGANREKHYMGSGTVAPSRKACETRVPPLKNGWQSCGVPTET